MALPNTSKIRLFDDGVLYTDEFRAEDIEVAITASELKSRLAVAYAAETVQIVANTVGITVPTLANELLDGHRSFDALDWSEARAAAKAIKIPGAEGMTFGEVLEILPRNSIKPGVVLWAASGWRGMRPEDAAGLGVTPRGVTASGRTFVALSKAVPTVFKSNRGGDTTTMADKVEKIVKLTKKLDRAAIEALIGRLIGMLPDQEADATAVTGVIQASAEAAAETAVSVEEVAEAI